MPLSMELDRIVPISDFSRGKAVSVFARVGSDEPLLAVKRNQPTAIITSVDDCSNLVQIAEDFALLSETLSRLEEWDSTVLTHEQVLASYGCSRATLDSEEDIGFE